MKKALYCMLSLAIVFNLFGCRSYKQISGRAPCTLDTTSQKVLKYLCEYGNLTDRDKTHLLSLANRRFIREFTNSDSLVREIMPDNKQIDDKVTYPYFLALNEKFGNPKIRVGSLTGVSFYSPFSNTIYLSPFHRDTLRALELDDYVSELAHAKQFSTSYFRYLTKSCVEKVTTGFKAIFLLKGLRQATIEEYTQCGNTEYEAHFVIEDDLWDCYDEVWEPKIHSVDRFTQSSLCLAEQEYEFEKLFKEIQEETERLTRIMDQNLKLSQELFQRLSK